GRPDYVVIHSLLRLFEKVLKNEGRPVGAPGLNKEAAFRKLAEANRSVAKLRNQGRDRRDGACLVTRQEKHPSLAIDPRVFAQHGGGQGVWQRPRENGGPDGLGHRREGPGRASAGEGHLNSLTGKCFSEGLADGPCLPRSFLAAVAGERSFALEGDCCQVRQEPLVGEPEGIGGLLGQFYPVRALHGLLRPEVAAGRRGRNNPGVVRRGVRGNLRIAAPGDARQRFKLLHKHRYLLASQ
nr:hypothetical protein [Tanacetum cinerariifolium]